MTLGQIVHTHRKRLGLSQEALANSVSMCQPSLSLVERDKRLPSVLDLARLQRKLGFDVEKALEAVLAARGEQ